MKSLRYEDNEQEFLEAMAKRWGFNDKYKLVFVQRFLTANDDLDNQSLAEVLEEPLKKYSQNAYTLRDCLKEIYKKLEAEGCPSNQANKDKREIVQAWLRETLYPEWLKERLWEQLKKQAIATDKMGPVLVERVPTLGMQPPKKPSPYLKTVQQGSDILFKMNLEIAGHLMLLEREPSGAVYCLCPSEYAPKSLLPTGEAVLPQPGSEYPSFAATEEGCEQILAVINQEVPTLDWLPHGSQEPLKLDKNHLEGLLEYLNGSPNSKVLYMEYTVTAS